MPLPITLEKLRFPGSGMPAALLGKSVSLNDPIYKQVTGTDQAANTEVSDTVPAGKCWILLHAEVSLVTDANVANRTPIWVFTDGTAEFMRVSTGIQQTATTTVFYALGDFGSAQAGAVGSNFIATGIPTMILPAGYKITTVTTNRQVGDNYGAPIYTVLEFDVV